MEEDLPAAVDIVMKYSTYEEFLDSQVTRLDLSYLEVLMINFYLNEMFLLNIRMKN